MLRDAALERARDGEPFDVLIVGGGATGLGAAVDAAVRGHSVCLIEQADFGSGTSSRSTKLIHGGVRYLRQGQVSLVLGALRERERLRRNAPHMVCSVPFVIPSYRWWQRPYYGVGLKLYEKLGGEDGFDPCQILSRSELVELLPTLERTGLSGGVLYHDGQFDDARLAITLALTAADHGAVMLNRVGCVGLIRESGRTAGALARDHEGGEELEIRARVVINATGPFADAVRRQDDPGAEPLLSPSQGVHIVLPREFLPGEHAMLIPRTDDGRVIFAVPWHGCVVAGTTDTPVDELSLEPRALQEEFDFLLTHLARYLSCDPKPDDVLSVFAGLRPLVKGGAGASTASLSRDHLIMVSSSALITIVGGKWTTYRKMAEDVIDRAEQIGRLAAVPSTTATLSLRGATAAPARIASEIDTYGTDADHIAELIAEDPSLGEYIDRSLDLQRAEVVWFARAEMARTVDDALSRRSRSLILDAAAAIRAAPAVAEILGRELGWSQTRQAREIADFEEIAGGYLASRYA